MKFTDVFKNKSTAFSFFLSIIVWGIGTGCFAATMNNFLSDMHDMTSQDRGSLEFFREMPGLALVFLFALLNRMSDWKILRLGTMISMLGAALLFVPSNKVIVTFFIMIWSLGEHLIMPVRQAIAIQIAKPENAGQSLGFLTSAMNFGNVAGSAIVAVIFYVGVKYSGMQQRTLYNIVWGLIAVLMIVSTISTFNKNAPDETAASAPAARHPIRNMEPYSLFMPDIIPHTCVAETINRQLARQPCPAASASPSASRRIPAA